METPRRPFDAMRTLSEGSKTSALGRLAALRFGSRDRNVKGSKDSLEAAQLPTSVLLSVFPSPSLYPVTCNQCLDWYTIWLVNQLKTIPTSTLSVVVGHDATATQWTLPLAKAFSEIAQCAKTAQSPSIDDITEHLVKKGVLEVTTRKESHLEARNFVFAVLGWQTMLYRPALGICPPQQLAVADEQDGYRGQAFMTLKQHHLSTKRPIHELLMGFGILLPPANYCTSTDLEERRAFDDLKTIGSDIFNAFLLDSIAHVKFKWVDVVSCHLEFDERTNTLFLFRFPSFCAVHHAATQTEKKEPSVIGAAASPASSSRQWAIEEDIHLMLQEILVSYRLLFGQNKQARKLFSRCGPAVELPANIQDQLLPQLCEYKSFRLVRGSLDKDSYDLKQDFPVLRSRIARLHKILSARKPRSWTELWRDKRDSSGWYTFWTVLIFGGVSILLTVFQVVLQAVQLARQ
ncbi:MAG: hypothetical protein Q9169_006127 [Polycauliona sp. 2 TL-2023]